MSTCKNCGKQMDENTKFCPSCGAEGGQIPAAEDTRTSSSTPKDKQISSSSIESENKVIFILAYLGILFFLPLVSTPDSKAGRFHANQGLLILIASVAGEVVIAILSSIILSISWRLWMITSLLAWAWAVLILVLIIIGMINANKGEQKPLPVIGKITIIK